MKKTQILINFRKIAHGIFHHRLLFQCRLLLKFRKFFTVDYYSVATIIRDLRVYKDSRNRKTVIGTDKQLGIKKDREESEERVKVKGDISR